MANFAALGYAALVVLAILGAVWAVENHKENREHRKMLEAEERLKAKLLGEDRHH